MKHIPKSEFQKSSEMDKGLYKVMGWLGLTSGIGLVGIGAWWFLWNLFGYIFTTPQTVYQQMVGEYRFMQAQMGVIIIGLGAIIMTIKKISEDFGERLGIYDKEQDTEEKEEVPTNCPQCDTEFIRAIIEDGGQGEWCTNCKMSLKKIRGEIK